MKKLSKEETEKLSLKHGLLLQGEKIYEELKKLEISESLLINQEECPSKISMGTTYFNNLFTKRGLQNRYKMRSLQNGKQYCYIRIF